MYIPLLEPRSAYAIVDLEQAVVETLAYSDVFDYPLTLQELHRYLPLRVSLESLQAGLQPGLPAVGNMNGYFYLKGRERLVALRLRRESISRPTRLRALQIGRILGHLPFVRMVALTGSLAVLNSDRGADLDYMLVTAPGRVWMSRGFVLLLGRLTAAGGHTLCPNLIVSENALAWAQQDLYAAREICQMLPIIGFETYAQFRYINGWTAQLLPNAAGAPTLERINSDLPSRLQPAFEWPLRGGLGDRIESWEMGRKVRRLRSQASFGDETRFDADVCQGNFDHHGALTRQALQERLSRLGPGAPAELSSTRAGIK